MYAGNFGKVVVCLNVMIVEVGHVQNVGGQVLEFVIEKTKNKNLFLILFRNQTSL